MKRWVIPSLSLVASFTLSTAHAANVFLEIASGAGITQFEAPLVLTELAAPDQGLSVSDRQLAISFVDDVGVAADLVGSDATNYASFSGSPSYYLYKRLTANTTLAGDQRFGAGTTGNNSNQPLVFDLGESDLTVTDNLEGQGAHFVTTVNSLASSAAMVMNGTSALSIDAASSGQVIAGQFVEQTENGLANFKVLVDLNSTLRNASTLTFATETAGQSGNNFVYDVTDAENSRLFDTSYVINSRASVAIDVNDNESIILTFSRANDEYIEKSFTRAHPSNDAALKLGTIAADGVALGDMQTALTLLDLDDFGYGDTAANLAVEVKRLAPIANNSMILAGFDGLDLVAGASDYRFAARRGNWSGQRDKLSSIWARTLSSRTQSSGSVATPPADSQDVAGHDGFGIRSNGVSLGWDRAGKDSLFGLSFARLTSHITQADDRAGEHSELDYDLYTAYLQLNDRYGFFQLSATRGTGDIEGDRKTAVDRVAQHVIPVDSTAMRVKAGRRFDLADGRSAITPYAVIGTADYEQANYQEAGAGALSLNVAAQKVSRSTTELGVNLSHKRRLFGRKSLHNLSVAVGNHDVDQDLTVTAHYTGDTHSSHDNYTTFTTPAEAWRGRYARVSGDFQVEIAEAVFLRAGLALEAANSRQRVTGELGLVWPF